MECYLCKDEIKGNYWIRVSGETSDNYCGDCIVSMNHIAAQKEMIKRRDDLDNLICGCGHRFEQHGPTGSINYSAGHCKECRCTHFMVGKEG